jgi:hypothetical protein
MDVNTAVETGLAVIGTSLETLPAGPARTAFLKTLLVSILDEHLLIPDVALPPQVSVSKSCR